MNRVALEVARKEFLENVLSWKFLIALVLSVLIVSTSVLVLGAQFRDDYETYAIKQAEYERQDHEFADIALEIYSAVGRPNLLSIFVGGPGDDMRRNTLDQAMPVFSARAGGGSDIASGGESPLAARFDPLDLAFVAVVVMTFMAVVYAYDAVSGERERGTLKLMLANPVPKDAVLVGKYLGGMASLLFPFGVAVVIGLALVPVAGLRLDAGAYARLGVMLGLFVLVVSAFYLVGLLVSSLARRSGTSLIALALVWLVLVFGVGNVAALAAEKASGTTTGADVQQRFAEMDEAAANDMGPLFEEMVELDQKSFRGTNLTPAEEARRAELRTQIDEKQAKAESEREAFIASVRGELDDQLATAEAIASVSPAEAWRNLASGLAGSDYWTFKRQREAVEAYIAEVDRAREEWISDHPGADGPRAGVIMVGPGGIIGGGGDRFDPPAFEYRAASVGEQMSTGRAARDLLVLVGANILAFAAAYAAFLRYDVR